MYLFWLIINIDGDGGPKVLFCLDARAYSFPALLKSFEFALLTDRSHVRFHAEYRFVSPNLASVACHIPITPSEIAFQTWQVSPGVFEYGLLHVPTHWCDLGICWECGNALCCRTNFCMLAFLFPLVVCRLRKKVGLTLDAFGIIRFSRWDHPGQIQHKAV